MNRIWDRRLGEYVDIVEKKGIRILENLYFKGHRLVWDIPEPVYIGTTEQEEKELDYYLDNVVEAYSNDNIWNDIPPEIANFWDNWSGTGKNKEYAKRLFWYKNQKYLNMILAVLPWVNPTAAIMGYLL